MWASKKVIRAKRRERRKRKEEEEEQEAGGEEDNSKEEVEGGGGGRSHKGRILVKQNQNSPTKEKEAPGTSPSTTESHREMLLCQPKVKPVSSLISYAQLPEQREKDIYFA